MLNKSIEGLVVGGNEECREEKDSNELHAFLKNNKKIGILIRIDEKYECTKSEEEVDVFT